MPRPRKHKEHDDVMLNKLQAVVEHDDPEVATGRRSSVDKWTKTHSAAIEYLKDNELQFLFNIFRNKNSWSGIRLNNIVLGRMLTQERLNGVKNPFCRYNMACKYCVIEKIHKLFQEKLKAFKGSFSPEEVDIRGRSLAKNARYVQGALMDSMERQHPVFTFWIDEKSGEFKKHEDAVDGFRKAVKLRWNEGVEYFYSCVHKDQDKRKDIDNMVISTITLLSSTKSTLNLTNTAMIIDFLVREILTDPAKYKLLPKLANESKGNGLCYPFNALISQNFLDTVYDLVNHLSFQKSAMAGKNGIISHRDFVLVLFSLSHIMLDSHEVETQAKARVILFNIWHCGVFDKHKKALMKASKDMNLMTDVLAGLLIEWKRDNNGGDISKKREILEILRFAREHGSEEDFLSFKRCIIRDLKYELNKSEIKDNIDNRRLVEDFFAELEND